MSKRTEQRQAVLVLALPAAVALLAGTPSTSLQTLQSLESTDPLGSGPVLAVVALIAWALTGWLALVVAVSLGERLPGTVGRAAQQCLTRVAPASLRSLVRTATGVAVAGAVLLSGTAAHADPARTDPHRAATVSTGTFANLDWPTAPATPAPLPSAPRVTEPSPHASVATRPTASAPGPGVVVVQPGDCLWDLAAQALGPDATASQIATAWPSWWTANRALIGDDPHLLRPGTPLLPPQHP